MSDRIRIVIIDDHPLFRSGIVQTLEAEADIEVLAQGATADEAVQLTRDLLPDLLLLDVGIPGGGLNAAQTVATVCPATKIVMITGSDQEENLLAALRAGAKAYVLKGVSARELVAIVRGAAAGEVYITPSLATSLLMEMSNTVSAKPALVANPLDELTEREHGILELVAGGASNKEIGQKLFLTEKTVKHYMTNILQKLQVRNRVEAALLAQRSAQAGDQMGVAAKLTKVKASN